MIELVFSSSSSSSILLNFVKVSEGNFLNVIAVVRLACLWVNFLVAEFTVTAIRGRDQKNVWILLDLVDRNVLVFGDRVIFGCQNKGWGFDIGDKEAT